MNCRRPLFLTVCFALTAIAQQTTTINLNFTLTTQTRIERTVGLSHRSVTPFGVVAVQTDLTHPRGNGGVVLGNDQGTVSFVFNRLDSFDVSVDIPNAPGTGAGPKNFTGNISGGIGAYKGATGSVAFALSTDNFGANILSGSGTVIAAGKTTSFSLSPPLPLGGSPFSGDHNVFTGSGAATPIGNATVKANLDSNSAGGNDGPITLTFNSADSISLYLSYNS